MAPRPANPQIKDKLMDAAQDLVLRQGFSGTGVEQICRQAGVARGSFFHYFATKTDLGVAMLERFAATQRDFMATGPHVGIADPRERVSRYLRWMVELSEHEFVLRGCPIGCVGQELSRVNPELREVGEAALRHWAASIEEDLAAAKKQYAPRANWKPSEVAEHFIVAFQGGLLMVRIQADDGALRRSIEQYKRYVEGLLADS